jgi:CheY-like chemotaxis protein
MSARLSIGGSRVRIALDRDRELDGVYDGDELLGERIPQILRVTDPSQRPGAPERPRRVDCRSAASGFCGTIHLMAIGGDRYGKCESCETLRHLRFSKSGGGRFSWICVPCRAAGGSRLEPAEVDLLQAERFISEHMMRVAPIADASDESPAEGRTILVVDDDYDTRNAACSVLDAGGFLPLQVENGKEGLDLLAKLEVKPRLILLDLWMPIMNGWDFYEHVSRDRVLRSIPVIVLTACDLEPNVHSLKWLRKPIGMDALLDAVRASCAS